MKNRTLLITTILSAAIIFNGTDVVYAADRVTVSTMNDVAQNTVTKAEVDNPRTAATSFIEHVNFARIALAMNNINLARQNINYARNMVKVIKSATSEQRKVTEVESGRIIYKYDTAYKYHYFPIQTGPVQVKTMGTGPMWAKNDLAVIEADIVYLTLDLTGNNAENHLDKTMEAISAKNLKLADKHLAELTEEIVTVDSIVSTPNIKASDNITLARNFIAGENYEGAAYALKHADDALDEMQNDNNNKAKIDKIAAMRKDVGNLQEYVAKKDPSMIQKMNSRVDSWWKDLKDWSVSKN
jgi:hypothetical protein